MENLDRIQNIGIDLDGVIFDKARFQLDKGRLFFAKLKGLSQKDVVKNFYGYDVKDVFGCGEFTRFLFWAIYVWEYCLNTSPNFGIIAIIKKWLSEGRNVYIISGRKETEEFFVISFLLTLLTRVSLKKNGINYTNLYFCADSNSACEKEELCRRLHIDLMIDDRLDVLEALREYCHTLCMKDIWNTSDLTSIPQIDNIYEADTYIKKLELVKKVS